MTQRIAAAIEGLRRGHPASARLALGLLLALSLAAPALASALATPGFAASVAAGAATGLGAIGVLAVRRLNDRGMALFIALAGGMMLAAALFSLLLPAVALSSQPWALDVALAAAVGYAAMAAIDRALPHLHPTPGNGARRTPAGLLLMVIAIVVHNLPEGLAVGAGFGGGAALGWSTALAIGVQNVPEGLIVATALWAYGLPRRSAALAAAATGLIEPLGALVASAAASASQVTLALALAGGAMLFVVFDELIPEVWRWRAARAPVAALPAGFIGLALLIALVP